MKIEGYHQFASSDKRQTHYLRTQSFVTLELLVDKWKHYETIHVLRILNYGKLLQSMNCAH